jgi:hypothetical protein
MLVPAMCYKDELEALFKMNQYSEAMLFYNGCIENYEWTMKEEDGRYQYAIVNQEDNVVVGYISYRVDYYAHQVCNFGLICLNQNSKYKMTMALGIAKVVEEILSIKPRRIEFRYVADNKAGEGYQKIVRSAAGGYKKNLFQLTEYMRDKYGKYHNLVICELIDYWGYL